MFNYQMSTGASFSEPLAPEALATSLHRSGGQFACLRYGTRARAPDAIARQVTLRRLSPAWPLLRSCWMEERMRGKTISVPDGRAKPAEPVDRESTSLDLDATGSQGRPTNDEPSTRRAGYDLYSDARSRWRGLH